MKIPYCTCRPYGKESFSTAALIVGAVGLFVFAGLLVGVLVSMDLALLVLWAVFMCLLLWNFLDFRYQAHSLGHSSRCATRYGLIAATVINRGYSPQYAQTAENTLLLAILVVIFGKKNSRKAYRGMRFGTWIAVATGVTWVSYDGLTRQRSGLPAIGSKYEPVLSEAIWAAVFIPVWAFLLYVFLKARVQRTRLLLMMLIAATVGLWLVSVYVLSWYAHVSFLLKARDVVGVLAVVVVTVFLLDRLSSYWSHRKRKRKH